MSKEISQLLRILVYEHYAVYANKALPDLQNLLDTEEA